MSTYNNINAFMKYDMELFEKRVLWKLNTFLNTKTDPTSICDPNSGSFNTFACTLALTISVGSYNKEVYNSHFCVA